MNEAQLFSDWSPSACHELVAVHPDLPLHKEWPSRPGAVRRAVRGDADVLHFAPGRWLVIDGDAGELDQLTKQFADDLMLIDVCGKWHALRLPGEYAQRVLRAQISLERILGQRACAAVSLFDCPCILVARGDAFDVWTRASYVHCLKHAMLRAWHLLPQSR